MENRLEDNKDFQKVDVCRKLFNRCTLEELTALHRLVEDGSVRRLVGKFNNQEFKKLEAEIIVSSTHTHKELLTTNQL